ncbi:MAG: ATP-binding protein [Gilvibacter sp.]
MDDAIHIEDIYNELAWLEQIINQVIRTYLVQEGHENDWRDILAPDLKGSESAYAQTVTKFDLESYERIALALVMAPEFKPDILDIFFGKNQLYDRAFTEFGGVVNTGHSGFLPTLQTLMFLLTVNNPYERPRVDKLIDNSHPLVKEGILWIDNHTNGSPVYSRVILASPAWVHYIRSGEQLEVSQLNYFPATKISTALTWDDIVLDNTVLEQIKEIETWITRGETVMRDWGLQRILKPGYRALLYGPPGTGKTLTATLLGKQTGRDVYKIDLSMIVSKYIGETEKNLARIFDLACDKDWILFFDEADALFGKRTATNSSNDRHANQQTAYLLQRIEDFPGTVILASNLKSNMDEAFSRRFQSMIMFNMPTAEQRYEIWQKSFSGELVLAEDVDLANVAQQYELSGGAIINVLRYCALQAVSREEPKVNMKDVLKGIRKEFKKDNKTLPRV